MKKKEVLSVKQYLKLTISSLKELLKRNGILFMKITVKQLKQLIREQVEEMSHMGGAMEARRKRDAEEAEETVYTPDDIKKLAHSRPEQLLNIGRDAYGRKPHKAFIQFPSGRQEEISEVMVDEYGDVQVDFVALVDPIAIPLASAKRRR